ncbi:MAG: hypothetical protein ACK4WH_03860 [Phycisphaerales bacterium]
MSFLNRQSILGKLFMGLACVAFLAAMVAAVRPFEPAAAVAAEAPSTTVVAASR